LIKTLVSGHRQKGIYSIVWDGSNENGNQLSSGIYFTRLVVGQTEITSKLVLLK